MTHEPECRAVTFADPPETNRCPDCWIARAAYLRGIRDASVTVRYLVDKFEADTVQRGDK